MLKVLQLLQEQLVTVTSEWWCKAGAKKVGPAGGTPVLEEVASVNQLLRGLPSWSSLLCPVSQDKCCLINLPCRQPDKLLVVISNDLDHNITILAKILSAELSANWTILSHKESIWTRISQGTWSLYLCTVLGPSRMERQNHLKNDQYVWGLCSEWHWL